MQIQFNCLEYLHPFVHIHWVKVYVHFVDRLTIVFCWFGKVLLLKLGSEKSRDYCFGMIEKCTGNFGNFNYNY